MKQPLVFIGGPTACGKTAFSIALAKRIGGEIISADSMQVYHHMDIGTAKVRPEEMEGIAHFLVDELPPDAPYNVMLFQARAKAYMQEIWARGNVPIVVGGTGFYVNALLYDTAFTQTEGDAAFREACELRAQSEEGKEELYQSLREIDPEYAEIIHANNSKRVIRALEYHHLTGEKFSAHNAEQKQNESPYNAEVILLETTREQLVKNIELRVDLMMQEGLLAEVEGLLARGYGFDLVSMQGIGYKEFQPYFAGELTLEEAVANLKTATRRFAKRQMTWFRRQTEGDWIDLSRHTKEEALELAIRYLEEKQIIPTDGSKK